MGDVLLLEKGVCSGVEEADKRSYGRRNDSY